RTAAGQRQADPGTLPSPTRRTVPVVHRLPKTMLHGTGRKREGLQTAEGRSRAPPWIPVSALGLELLELGGQLLDLLGEVVDLVPGRHAELLHRGGEP